ETEKNSERRLEHEVRAGTINVITQDQSGTHVVFTKRTVASVAKGSDATISSGDADVISVRKDGAKIGTPQGNETLEANQRIDVTKEKSTRSELPPPPTISGPENGKQFLVDNKPGNGIDFSWQPVANADHYKIMISPVPTFPMQALNVNRDG